MMTGLARFRWTVALCVVAMAGSISPGKAEVATVDIPIDIAAVDAFTPSEEGFAALPVVADLSGGGPVRIEFEKPDQALKMTVASTTVDGKKVDYVSSFSRMVYHVYTDKARDVRLWAMVRHSEPAAVWTSGYQWSSQREFQQQEVDPREGHKQVAGKWRWVLIRTLRLNPGITALDMRYSHPGPPEMDFFVVTSDRQPPAKADAPTPTVAPISYVAASDDIALPGAMKLVSARTVGQAQGGKIEASLDGGKTWQVAKDVDLAGRFRLRWTSDKKPVGRLEGFRAQLACDTEKVHVLDNGAVRVVIDTVTPGIFRMESVGSGGPAAVSAPSSAPYLYALEPKQVGKPWPDPRYGESGGKAPLTPDLTYWLRPRDGVLERVGGTKESFAITHSYYDGKLKVTASIDLRKDGPDRWTLTLDNTSDWDILTWTFPRLDGVKIGRTGYDDHWLNTNIYGPWPAGRGVEDRPYPGWGALGFVDLYDSGAGLAMMNTELRQGIVNFKLRHSGRADTVSLEAERRHRAASGTTTTWTYRLMLHEGDWHVPADVYGEWFRRTQGTADHWPAWVRQSNGWLSTNTCLQDRSFKWPMLLDTLAEAQKIGIDHVQVWGQFGSSSCASFWWPSPKYGSIEEFARVNREIRNRGGHIGYYLMYDRENRYNLIDETTYDGYLPQSAYPEGVPILPQETFVKGHVVRNPEGKITAWPQTDEQWAEFRANLARLHEEGKTTTWANNKDGTFPGSSMAKMNPDDADWQRWLVMWTNELYGKKWNCDTAYQDVLGCGRVGRSFDLRRGDHGNIPNGNEDIARQLTEVGRKADPDWVLSAEGKSELVTRWALGMTSSRHYGWIDLHAHRYTHPDHILYLGGANGGYRQMDHNCELAYLFGAKFELILTGKVERIKRTVLFRENIKPLFFQARYRDTVGLTVADDGIVATRHDWADDTNRIVTVAVVNRSGTEDGKLTVDLKALPIKPARAFWVKDDWTVQPAPVEPGKPSWTVAVPSTRVNALVMVERADPSHGLVGGVMGSRRPGGLDATVWAARLQPRWGGNPLTAKVLWKDQVVATQQLGAIDGKVLKVDLDGVDEGFLRLTLDDKPAAFHYIEPMVEDGSFEGRGGSAVDDAPQGKRVAVLGPAKGWSGTHRKLTLEGGLRYRVTVSAWRTGTKGNMYGLVRLMDEAGKWHYTRLNFPKDRYNEWVQLTAEFTAPKVVTGGNIYLYNMNSEETVRYDDVRIEMLAEK